MTFRHHQNVSKTAVSTDLRCLESTDKQLNQIVITMKKAIVLGGTLPHVTLIEKLKNRGFKVILVDYLEKPYAKKYADKHIQASTLDLEAVTEIARTESVDLVISTCIDQANVTACYVSEKLGLPHPYSYKTALAVTDKLQMKKIMVNNHILTSKFLRIKSVDEPKLSELKYPLIVKPVDCNSSKGVKKIEAGDSHLVEAIKTAIDFSRTKEAIIEEFVTGTEIGIDTFVVNGIAHVLMIKERRKVKKNNGGIQQILGCTWPLPEYDKILVEAERIANSIAKAFELRNCALMIQAILQGDQISVIEFGARIGGGESFRIIKNSTSFDYVEASINSFLGETISLDYHNPQGFYADNFIYAKQCVFGGVQCPKELLEDGTIEYLNELRPLGVEIGEQISSNNRVGVAVVKAETVEELYKKIDKTISALEVFDMDGNPVMRKDIY